MNSPRRLVVAARDQGGGQRGAAQGQPGQVVEDVGDDLAAHRPAGGGDPAQIEAQPAVAVHESEVAGQPVGAVAPDGVELGGGVEPRLVGGDDPEQPVAVQRAVLLEPVVVARDPRLGGRVADRDPPRPGQQRRLDARGHRIVGRDDVVGVAAASPQRLLPEDRVADEAVVALGGQQRVELAPCACRVKPPPGDRVKAGVPVPLPRVAARARTREGERVPVPARMPSRQFWRSTAWQRRRISSRSDSANIRSAILPPIGGTAHVPAHGGCRSPSDPGGRRRRWGGRCDARASWPIRCWATARRRSPGGAHRRRRGRLLARAWRPAAAAPAAGAGRRAGRLRVHRGRAPGGRRAGRARLRAPDVTRRGCARCWTSDAGRARAAPLRRAGPGRPRAGLRRRRGRDRLGGACASRARVVAELVSAAAALRIRAALTSSTRSRCSAIWIASWPDVAGRAARACWPPAASRSAVRPRRRTRSSSSAAGAVTTSWCSPAAFRRGPLAPGEFVFAPYVRSFWTEGELPGIGRQYGLAFHGPRAHARRAGADHSRLSKCGSER